MTALVPFPKRVLCQFLVNRCLCCKKHCHSWLQWVGQKPKTWRLRNLLGNLPGKEKKLHCSNPVQKDWVCLAQLLAPAVRAVSSFQLDVWARTALEQGSTTCLRFLLSIPDAGLLQSASQGGHMAKAATILSWAAPRSHKSKSAFVCQTRHLKYHPKRSQKRFWSFLSSVDQTLLPAQTVQPDQHDRYSCKEYNFSCFSTYLPSPSAICWHEYVL